MKPENYSLKFQNSLADSRITPGSQHGKGRASTAPKARNGLRAPRKPTKAQASQQMKALKKQAALALNTNSQEDEERLEKYAQMRLAEKEAEKQSAAALTGILKSSKSLPTDAKNEAEDDEEEWNGFDDDDQVHS